MFEIITKNKSIKEIGLQWISVSDSLPEEYISVLVVDHDGVMFIGQRLGSTLMPVGSYRGEFADKAAKWTYINPLPFDDLIVNIESYKKPISKEEKENSLKRFVEDYASDINTEKSDLPLASVLSMQGIIPSKNTSIDNFS